MNRRQLPVLIILVLLALGGALLAAACGGDSTEPEPTMTTADEQAEERFNPFNPLIDIERRELSICVAGLGGHTFESSDVTRISTALDAGLAKFSDLPEEAGTRRRTEGRQPTRIPLGEATGGPGTYARAVEGVDSPSEHFMFVYFLPEDLYTATFPHFDRYALGAAESFCAGDECETATLGLFLPSNAGADAIENALLEALRLAPSTRVGGDPELTPGFELDGPFYYPPTPTPRG